MRLLILAVVLALAGTAHAQSISGTSGTLTNGTSITISGSGFGTKPTATPHTWDTMNGTNGTTLSTDARGFIVVGNLPYPVLSNTRTRSTPSRTTCVSLGQTGNDVPGFGFGEGSAAIAHLGLSTSGTSGNLRSVPSPLIIDYWMNFDEGGSANNYKFIRWHSITTPGSINNYWSMPDGLNAAESSTFTFFNDISTNDIEDRWRHIRLYMNMSNTQNQVVFEQFIDNVKRIGTDASGNYDAQSGGYSEGAWPTWSEAVGSFVWEMQNDTLGSGGRDSKQYICDIYVDTGYSRFELVDNSANASVSHYEIQPYTSWSATSVAITLNIGTFASDASAWLRWCDRTSCSTPFAVTLGSGGGGGGATKINNRLRRPEFAALFPIALMFYRRFTRRHE